MHANFSSSICKIAGSPTLPLCYFEIYKLAEQWKTMRLTGKILKKITHLWQSGRRFDNLLINDLNIIPTAMTID